MRFLASRAAGMESHSSHSHPAHFGASVLLVLATVVFPTRIISAQSSDGFVFPLLGVSQTDPTTNTTDPLTDGWGGNGVGWSGLLYYDEFGNPVWGYGHMGQDYYRTAGCSGAGDYTVGLPVYAVSNGTVDQVVNNPNTTYGWDDNGDHGWGRVIVIKHTLASGSFNTENAMLTPNPNDPNPSVVYTLYGHLKKDSISVNAGDTVTKGQKIAEIDDGGVDVSWGCSHLHFEIKTDAAYYQQTYPEYCCISRYVPGVGRGYSGTDNEAPNRYLPGPFISNNRTLGKMSLVTGDWNQDGADSVWKFVENTPDDWYVPRSSNWNAENLPDDSYFPNTGHNFGMGLPGDFPVVGDWDGDTQDDIGTFRPGRTPYSAFFLDTNRDAGAEWTLELPGHYPDDIPVVGDWDGDGDDDVGAWNSASQTFYLFTINRSTYPWTLDEYGSPFAMGGPDDIPIAGDWDGDGQDEVGVFQPGKPFPTTNNFIFRKSDGTEVPITTLGSAYEDGWGNNGDIPVVGNWDGNTGDVYDTIGLYRPSENRFYFADLPMFGGAYPPTVYSTTVSNVGPTTATLWGSVNPNGSLTTVRFEYGQTTSYGSRTPPSSAGSGSSFRSYSATVTGLSCGTIYHFRALAVNAGGSAEGLDEGFTTAACPSQPHMWINTPNASSTVSVPFTISGWAVDLAAPNGTGVNAVAVWAIPQAGGANIFLGLATLGIASPGVEATFGSQFANSGYTLNVTTPLAGGKHTLVVFARSTVTGTFNNSKSVTITVPGVSDPRMALQLPAAGTTVAMPLTVVGWAVDLGASFGSGVDVVAVWAVPQAGGANIFLGLARLGIERPAVGAAFGPQFSPSGYELVVSGGLPSGNYTLVVFARSAVTGTYNNSRAVAITVSP